MSIVTEFITMQISEEVSDETFMLIVDDLEHNYHAKRPGFLDTELLFDEKNNTWAMIQHWDSRENLMAASRQMFKDSAAESFVKCIVPSSVKMLVFAKLKTFFK